MKIKKSMIILIIAIFLLSIASVCASDVDDELSSDMENTVIELSDENLNVDNEQSVDETAEETLSASVDDEIVTAENDLKEPYSDTSVYSDLAGEIAGGGDVTLRHQYYTYDRGETIEISGDYITIDGNGAVIDMAGSNIGALSVSGYKVTIKNLTIKNANYDGNGSAIYFAKWGIIEDCEFIDNNATYGAVFFSENGTMKNCNFNGNNASSGGATVFKGKGEVTNCTFSYNNAVDGGGIVFLDNAQLIDCSFNNNYAVASASAIRFRTDLEATLKNCNFTNNSGNAEGAVGLSFSNATLENCNFINNHAAYSGGGLNIGTGNLTNCTFVNNSAHNGAAVFVNYNCVVKNCIFDSNNASYSAGAIHMGSGEIENSNFTNNHAPLAGAVEMFEGTLKNCNLENNSATGKGGAIACSDVDIENCNFTNNEADQGGAIQCFEGNIRKSKFTNNKAESGGAIYAYVRLSIQDTQFEGNNANDGINNILFEGDVDLSLNNVTPEYLGPYEKAYLTEISATDVVYGNDVEVIVMASTKTEESSKTALGANGFSFEGMHSYYGGYIENFIPILRGSVFVYVFNVGIYSGEISNGIAKIKIPGLNAGTYNGLIVYDGGLDFNKPTELVTFKVLKQDAAITAGNKAYLINYGGKYGINLKDANGKAISGKNLDFLLNGKKIGSSITNAEGIATIKLTAKALKAVKSGKKNLVIKFSDNNYNPVSISAKITVKKEKTKIIAKNKKFKKSQKTKKYTISLKNSKGKAVKKMKVSLKIKGKTYTAKTNAKGKAIFKIKKLNKKGTFKATVTYKGNAYYNKAIKKVKIIIK